MELESRTRLTMKLALRASRRCFSMVECEARSSAVKDRTLFLFLHLLVLMSAVGLPDALPEAAGIAIERKPVADRRRDL